MDKQEHGWQFAIIQLEGGGIEAHVYPVGDFREHEITTLCWCNPTEDEDGTHNHHSMDRRETTKEQGAVQ